MRGGASARGMMECRAGMIIYGANEAEGRVAGPSPLLEPCPCTFRALRSMSLAPPPLLLESPDRNDSSLIRDRVTSPAT